MKINLKEYFKMSAIYTIAAAFPSVMQIILQPIIEGPGKLGAEDFSRIAIIESIAALCMVISSMSVGNALVRFYYDYEKDLDRFKIFVSSSFNSILFRGVLLFVVVYLFSAELGKLFSQEALRDFSSYGLAAVLIGVSRSINLTASNLFRNQRNESGFIALSLATGLIRFGFQMFWLFYVDMSFIGYATGSCVGGMLVSICFLVYCYSKYGFHFNRNVLVEMNQFAWPLFQYSLVNWGLMFLDRFFLESSPVELGIYDNALKFALGVDLLLTGMVSAVRPEIYQYLNEGSSKLEHVKSISQIFIAQSQVLIALLMLPIMLFILFFYDTELTLSAGLIPLVLVIYLIRAQFNIFSTIVLFQKETKAFFYFNAASLIVFLTMNYFLIPHFGYFGAIASSMTGNFILMSCFYWFQQKKLPIDWNFKKMYLFPLLVVLSTILLFGVTKYLHLSVLIYGLAVVAVMFFSVWVLYGKDFMEIKLVKRLIRRN